MMEHEQESLSEEDQIAVTNAINSMKFLIEELAYDKNKS